MTKAMITLGTALSIFALPVLADEARTPPTQPYYAPSQPDCDAVSLKLYFEPGTADLGPFARDTIRETRQQLSGCKIKKIDATARAGDAVSDRDRLSLAEARRETLMETLKAHDFRASEVTLRTDIPAAKSDAIMSRNADIEVETEPDTVG